MAKKRIVENGLTECANCGKMLPKDSFYKSKGGGLHLYCSDDGLFDLDYLKRCVEKDKEIDSFVCVDDSSKSLCKEKDEKVEKGSPRSIDCIEGVLSMLKAGKFNIGISVGYSEKQS